MADFSQIREILTRIYPPEAASRALEKIIPLLEKFPKTSPRSTGYFSQEDVVLITYGDSLRAPGEMPLKTFHQFARAHFKDVFSTIHFLPFFPYSSDDGFSVKDFFAIDPSLGDWEDVAAIRSDFDLMFDKVLNHVSAQSDWFDAYLSEKAGYRDLAIEVDPAQDLSRVTRPRALPLLTEFKKASGQPVHVWTTFSADQIDLNYGSIDVLIKMIEVLLFYVQKGAGILRFDAIAYLWKEIGTACIHLPRVHRMVKLFRSILDAVAPHVIIITETNVPHPENISYFGNGRDEAQMVYNFTLPPLLLHTLLKEDATDLSRWASGLQLDSDATTYFNFTASHDGIGVRPLEGILPSQDIARLADIASAHGAGVSMKQNPDGSQSPYELNITYVDAVMCQGNTPEKYLARKFLASQAIQYALPGVPATYIHSILGSRNWVGGVWRTLRARSINRERLNAPGVRAELSAPETLRARIFFPYMDLIRVRKRQPAFHPNAGFKIEAVHPKVFAVKRFCENQRIWALTNISSTPISISLPGRQLPREMTDLITGTAVRTDSIRLAPYQYAWLSASA